MKIEYEATFIDVNKNNIRSRLKKAGAKMVYPEFMMKRYVWLLPKGHEIDGSWARVRQEADKITLSVKIVADNKKIEDQKELCIEVDSFDTARDILNTLGCQEKAYQESKRELWHLDGAEVTIDEWPFLDPFVEIEAESEQIVKAVSKKLNFDYSQALFGSVDFQYADKYNITLEQINNKTPNITFDMKNPFIK
ncbi:CYTH domain-containing protein [Candidatus Parcubacteria bacterium]|jgi:adenylate cyclase, class 2|nr:CYTH domain-containing protein [Candidatus Parcubacteria bacterium]